MKQIEEDKEEVAEEVKEDSGNITPEEERNLLKKTSEEVEVRSSTNLKKIEMEDLKSPQQQN